MSPVRRPSAIRYLVPLAAGLAIAAFAAGQAEAAAAVETAYLALLVTAVLLPVAALSLRPELEVGMTAVLATTAAWVVPAGPTRGAAISLLLVFVLGVVTVRRQTREASTLAWATAIPLALALQLLVRAERLLTPGLDGITLVGLIALPVAAAVAAVVLARDRDPWLVLVALGSAFVLVPGFIVSITLALLLLAAVDLTRDATLRAIGWGGTLLVLAVAFYWEPALGLFLVACGVAHRAASNWAVAAAVAAAALGAAALMPGARTVSHSLHWLSYLPLLLPAAVTTLRHQWVRPLLALVLAAVALRMVPGPGVLAAPLVLLALTLKPVGALWQLQKLWSGLLVAGTTLLATYPWMRQQPLADALQWVALTPGWTAALAVVALVLLVAAAWGLLIRWRPELPPSPFTPALVVVALVAYASLPAAGLRPLGDRPVVLAADSPRFELELPAGTRIAELVLDTYLSNAATLPRGTPVAELYLTEGGDRRWAGTLQSGFDTAEWAARRPDVRTLPGFLAPPPWLSRVASSGDVFAQRYRRRKQLAAPVAADRLEITRPEGLPAGVSLAIFHLELRP